MILTQFQSIGSALSTRGLVSSHGGNLSVRLGERLIITRRGSMLGSLEEHDLVETGIVRNDRHTPLASTELTTHRAIYQRTTGMAVVHAHCPHTVALSFTEKAIVPRDMEGMAVLRKVPVVKLAGCSAAQKLEDLIADALGESRIVVVEGHGTFAIGQLLEEACHVTTALEESCHILYLLRASAARPPARSRRA